MNKATIAILALAIAGCQKPQPERQFKSGDIVKSRLTGERMLILGMTNRPFYYGEPYEVKHADGSKSDMVKPEEIELTK